MNVLWLCVFVVGVFVCLELLGLIPVTLKVGLAFLGAFAITAHALSGTGIVK